MRNEARRHEKRHAAPQRSRYYHYSHYYLGDADGFDIVRIV